MTPHWFVCPQPNPSAESRLFIFPYAGGSPAAFSKWTLKDIESQIVHYPGRGSRFNEPPIKTIDALAENIMEVIQPLLDKPFALFGHSLGGLVAYEVARSLRRSDPSITLRAGLPRPTRLFISACAAPQLPDSNPPIHSLPDDEFLGALKEFNGIPAEILNQPEALKILLPILRADFEAVESYRFESSEPPLDIPIVAFGGVGDERVSREQLEAWASLTTAAFTPHYFRGDHFFLNTNKDAILEAIRAEV